ncbi:MAG: SH3 domain-containing protein [Oscillospiraceae bacterium]|jgi:uncharacterized protein YgiM (DUF1202 family)|nr:SH3 domain-containing protein [Oscillospiraceae bacterium]
MKKWLGLFILLLVLGLMGGIAFAEETGYPVVVVNNRSQNDALPLYAAPSKNAAVLEKCYNGANAWLLDTQGNWCHVLLATGEEGYFQADHLVNMDAFTQLIPLERAKQRGYMPSVKNIPNLPMYDAPTTRSLFVIVPPEMKLTIRILSPVGTWYRVRLDDGREGFIESHQLDVMSSLTAYEWDMSGHEGTSASVICNPNSLNRVHLREEPSTDSNSLGRYFNGTQVVVLSRETIDDVDWLHVRVDGKEGYMMQEFLNHIYTKAEWSDG